MIPQDMNNLTPGCYCIHEWKRRRKEQELFLSNHMRAQVERDAFRRGAFDPAQESGNLKKLGTMACHTIPKKKPWWRFWK